MSYEQLIRDVPDFPKPGIVFKDISPLLLDAKAFTALVDDMAAKVAGWEFDKIAGIESRGFLVGGALAYKLNKGLILVRKPGKLPADTVRETYSLEYGEDSLEMHKDAVTPHCRVLVVDDVIATGGTARATAKLVEHQGGTVAGCLFIIELAFLDGLQQLKGYPSASLIRY